MKKDRMIRTLRMRERKAARRHARKTAAAAAALAVGAVGAADAGTAQAWSQGMSANNGVIAYDSNATITNGLDIWSVDPSGAKVDISNSLLPTQDSNPQWSPDGKKVAYATTARIGETPVTQVVVQTDTSNNATATVITATPGINDSALAWSPDGKYIAFAKGAPGARDIYVVNVSSTSQPVGTERQLTSDTADDANPTWSPDGQYVAFQSNRGTVPQYDIWRVNAGNNGSGPQDASAVDLTPGTDTSQEQNPDYSPGSAYIIFDSNRDNPQRDVYAKRADTGTTTYRMTTQQGDQPRFAPNGMKFVFQSNRTTPNGNALGDIWVQWSIPDTYTQAAPTDLTNDSAPTRNSHPDWQAVFPTSTCPGAGGTAGGGGDSSSSNSSTPSLPVDPSYPIDTSSVTGPVVTQNGTSSSGSSNSSSGSSGGGAANPDNSSNPFHMCVGGTGGSSEGGTGGSENGTW